MKSRKKERKYENKGKRSQIGCIKFRIIESDSEYEDELSTEDLWLMLQTVDVIAMNQPPHSLDHI